MKPVCPYCHRFNEEVFRELVKCPRCGANLTARIDDRGGQSVCRANGFIAHPTELDYGDVAVDHSGNPIRHDSQDVLRYALGLLEVMKSTLDFSEDNLDSTCVLGFLTGSESLDWLLRRRVGHAMERRIAHVRGLRHKGIDKQFDPDAELTKRLDAWQAAGVLDRLVVVDEFVSGTQLRTAFLRIAAWHTAQSRPTNVEVLLVGIKETREELDADQVFHNHVYMDDSHAISAGLTFSHRLIAVPVLFAMDKRGVPLKSVRLNYVGDYAASRAWPGGYEIACPNRFTQGGCTGTTVPWTAGSIDQVFGCLVYAICGFGYVQPGRWPETIRENGCATCKELLGEVRHLASKLSERIGSPERMFGKVVGSATRNRNSNARHVDGLLDSRGHPVES